MTHLNPSDIVQDMVVLYELSLAIGTSLDLHTNSEVFLKALLARKNLDYAALWIDEERLSYEHSAALLHRVFVLPKSHSRQTIIPQNHAFRAQLPDDRPLTFAVDDPHHTHMLGDVAQGSVALYPLKGLGVLELYSSSHVGGFPQRTLYQIQDLIDKFANSILAGLSHQRNLWEIEQRLRAEKEIKRQQDVSLQVMETMGQGLLITDKRGVCEYANPAFGALIGMTREDFIGRRLLDVAHSDDEATIVRNYQRVLDGETRTYDVHFTRQDGAERFFLVTSVPRRHEQAIDGVITVVTDATRQKDAEDRLAYARDEAIAAANLKSDFLATMSHEIRTPMNAVIGMTELLLDTNLDEEQSEFANIIASEANALLQLINEILDFSKIEAGKMILDEDDFSLRDLIESVGDTFSAKAREKSLALMTFVDPRIPELLQGDVLRLRQVLLNLVSNALKFTEEGEVALLVELVEQDERTATLQFMVEDTGIGIPGEGIQRLFQPFTQVDSSNTRRYGGTGLGLAIAQGIMELMGSVLNVESEEGLGSRFFFTVTLQHGQAHAAADEHIAHPPLGGIPTLIVDDNGAHRRILRRYLESWGLLVAEAANGDAALNRLRRAATAGHPYQMAIIDLAMVQMNGFDLAKAIHADDAIATPTMVLLTAYDAIQQGKQALEVGFSAYLTKPVRYQQLKSTLQKVLSNATTELHTPTAASEIRAVGEAKGLRVLVAEDNGMNQEVARQQLLRLGYHVTTVENGLEAVRVLEAQPGKYAAVLMDCQMSVMDGYTATRVIRSSDALHDQQPIIIAVTARAMRGDRERCLECGMDDYISKPVNIKLLEHKLHKWLHER